MNALKHQIAELLQLGQRSLHGTGAQGSRLQPNHEIATIHKREKSTLQKREKKRRKINKFHSIVCALAKLKQYMIISVIFDINFHRGFPEGFHVQNSCDAQITILCCNDCPNNLALVQDTSTDPSDTTLALA